MLPQQRAAQPVLRRDDAITSAPLAVWRVLPAAYDQARDGTRIYDYGSCRPDNGTATTTHLVLFRCRISPACSSRAAPPPACRCRMQRVFNATTAPRVSTRSPPVVYNVHAFRAYAAAAPSFRHSRAGMTQHCTAALAANRITTLPSVRAAGDTGLDAWLPRLAS